jgi:hypothetical protein
MDKVSEDTISHCAHFIDACKDGEIPVEYAKSILQAYRELKIEYHDIYIEYRRYL